MCCSSYHSRNTHPGLWTLLPPSSLRVVSTAYEWIWSAGQVWATCTGKHATKASQEADLLLSHLATLGDRCLWWSVTFMELNVFVLNSDQRRPSPVKLWAAIGSAVWRSWQLISGCVIAAQNINSRSTSYIFLIRGWPGESRLRSLGIFVMLSGSSEIIIIKGAHHYLQCTCIHTGPNY